MVQIRLRTTDLDGLFVDRQQNPVETNINFVDRKTKHQREIFSNSDKPEPAVYE